MAIRYFRLEQAASGSSPVTGDTIVMKWDDTVVPAGINQATTLNLMNVFPNATWQFRSRVWDLTDLGTGYSGSFDTEMISGEPWAYVSTIGTRVYVGYTFDIDTTFFAQNYITVKGPTGDFKSPRYQTNFYSASSFNDTSKLIGTDTNRYDHIRLTTQDDYDHVTNSGATTYNFSAATGVSSEIDANAGTAIIPYSATSARNYFNNLYDGWITESDDCSGNEVTSANAVIYSGNMHSRSESYESIYGGVCLRVDAAQIPYSGSPSDINLANNYDVVDTWYTDCDDCQSTSPYYGVYHFSGGTDCQGNSITPVVFTSDVLSYGDPLVGGSVNTGVFFKVNGECLGGEQYTIYQIEPTTTTGTISATYSTCADCTGNTSPIETHYYFSACTDGSIYRAVILDFDAELGAVSDGRTYLLEDISDLPNGCYTVVSSQVSYTDFVGYGPDSNATQSSTDCDDSLCDLPTPTPTNTPTPTPTISLTPTNTPTPSITPPVSTILAEKCDIPGIVYQITGYTGNSIVDQAFYLDFSDNSGCYKVVGDGEISIFLNITGVPTTDYETCEECNNSTPTPTPTNTPTPTPTLTNTPTPTPSITPTSSLTPTPSITPTSSVTPTPSNTPTSSVTPTPSITPTNSVTPTPTLTPGASPTSTPTNTPTPTPSITPTSSVTPTPSITPTSSVTPTPTLTPGASPTSTPTNTPTSSVTPTITPTVTPTITPSVTPTITPTVTPTITPSSTTNTPETNTIQVEDCCGGNIYRFESPVSYQVGTVLRLLFNIGPISTLCVTVVTNTGEGSTITPDGENIVNTGGCNNGECPTCPTPTLTETPTPTPTPTPTNTPTTTPTVTPTITPSNTPTVTPTSTITPTPSNTPAASSTPTPTPTPSPTRGNLADKLDSCEVTSQTQKVFVFYDGTSLDEEKASGASESIRSWYQTNVDDGKLLSGNLYEGIIGNNRDNGENWLWWVSYPYLGSLTGGTVSGSTVLEFNDPVLNSVYNSEWCENTNTNDCIPKSVQFRDDRDIYRRINRGRQLTGGYTTDDPRSNGVPFDHDDLDNSVNSGPGSFSGKEINYIVIIVADESDGLVGFYHGRQSKSQLYTDPFKLSGNGWDVSAGYEYTNRFQHDYESYLKVWEEIQNSGGTVNGLIYPVIDSSTARIPFVQHSIAAIEGETISELDFNEKYGDGTNSMTDMGPENLVLTALTYTNVYSGLTGTTAYQDLDPQYQNGAGLKNFGLYVDPKVTNFTETVVANTLDSFLTDIETPVDIIYVQPQGRQVGQVYQISGTCYTVAELQVSTREPVLVPTDISGPYIDCEICESSGCFSATTDGYYTFTDCCGNLQQGSDVGLSVCVDTAYSYQGLSVSTDPCVQICDQGPLDYDFAVTGVCENVGQGVIEITPIGGIPPYTIHNISGGTLPVQTGNGPFSWFNLSQGTYVFRLNDSSGGQNEDLYINVIVDGCFCANIDQVSGTTCGDGTSGYLRVNGSSNSLPYSIELYKNGTLFSTEESPFQSKLYEGLGTGVYYAFVTDFGGATAQTESVVIEESTQLDYGFDISPESPCVPGQGVIVITGLTGQPPYTYLWSNGQTTVAATGLTQGTWSVTVTDANDCETIKSVTLPLNSPLGIVSTTPSQPQCFDCDGTMMVTVSGGTSPYTYLGDTGQVLTTNQTSFTLTGLCAGGHSVNITDAGGCNVTATGVLNSTAGFNIVSVNTTNSSCNQSGSIEIQLNAPQGLFTYTVSDENGSSQSVTTSSQSQTFTNLSSGTYTVTIQTNNNNCVYTVEKTIENVDKFTVVTSITGDTCNSNNGKVRAILSPGSESLKYPFDYILTNIDYGQVVYQQIDISSSDVTISNLTSGNYSLLVTDNQNCTVTKNLYVSGSNNVNFALFKTNCILGNDGSITANIYDGEPPFTLSWSSNVPTGQSGLTVNGLAGGTYSLTITDSNGCTDTKSVIIDCNTNRVNCYELNNICEQEFITTVGNKRGFEEMLNEAYIDLSSGYTNCDLNTAVFYAIVNITGTTFTSGVTSSFYTGTTLGDYPSDEDWINAIQNILSSISEIGSFIVDLNNNQLKVLSDCDGDVDLLRGAKFSLDSKVELNLDCDPDNTTPTPTLTPTNTPVSTSTPTPTPTLTPTNTPVSTSTPTPTPSCTYKSWIIQQCTTGTCAGTCTCVGSTTRTVYTDCTVTDITAGGTSIYDDTSLITPFTGDFRGPSDSNIYSSSGSGVTYVCTIGGPC